MKDDDKGGIFLINYKYMPALQGMIANLTISRCLSTMVFIQSYDFAEDRFPGL